MHSEQSKFHRISMFLKRKSLIFRRGGMVGMKWGSKPTTSFFGMREKRL